MAIDSHPFSSEYVYRAPPSTVPSKLLLSNAPSLLQSTNPSKVDSLAEKITSLISRYLYLRSPGDQFHSLGHASLLRTVSRYITNNEQMEFVFPGFPFKSPSNKKVLGRLPDLGEELLLRRLEDLSRTIESCYAPGAVVRIVSDGIVYGEILGQDDHVVYRYNETLRKMTYDYGLNHITFVRVVDLLDSTTGLSFKVQSEEEYVSSIPGIRASFLSHEVPGYDLEKSMKEDPGTLRTYRGYLKFLESDLEGSDVMTKDQDGKLLSKKGQDRARRLIAKKMLVNGAKFSDLAALKFPHCIRLSVHPHSNAGPKFAFDMFPTLDMAASPWHNVVIEKADGSLTMGHFSSLDPSTYTVIYRNGSPYHIRENSPEVGRLLSSADAVAQVTPELTPNFPFGLAMRAKPSEDGARTRFQDLSMENLRALTLRYSMVILKGFDMPVDKIVFHDKISELSDNEIEEGRVAISDNQSYAMESPTYSQAGPTLQVVQCMKQSSSGPSKLLLTNAAMLFERGFCDNQRQWLSRRYLCASQPHDAQTRTRLVQTNPYTGRTYLAHREDLTSATQPSITDATAEESFQISNVLTDLLYDRRFCYAHTFSEGDLIVFDNKEVTHSRSEKSYPDEEMRYVRVY